jgi:hypothetical protein
MGKQEYKFSDHVRFGALPKVERKVITKMSNRGALRGLEHTSVCPSEIGAMLTCFEAVRARACAIAGRCAGRCRGIWLHIRLRSLHRQAVLTVN